MSVKKGISGLTSFLIWIGIFILCFCLLGAYVNPTKVPIMGLASLLIGPAIILNILLLLYSLFYKKRTGFSVLIALVLAFPQIKNLWGFNLLPNKSEITSEKQIKILTYNVRNFDLYNWSQNQKSKETIYNSIQEINPDIICFQEFYSKPNDPNWDNIKRLKEDLGFTTYYFTREHVSEKGGQWGIATFSKYPIINYGELLTATKKKHPNKTYNKGIYTDIVIKKDTLRIINTHLASLYFDNSDYSAIGHIAEPEGLSIEKSKPIISKLLSGFKRRGIQVSELKKFIKTEKQTHPIIICGDFNDIPTSYAYNRLSKNFQDGYLKSNWGLGASYNGNLPGLRIDFTLVDKSLKVESSKTIDLKISDHLPLLTTISIPEE